MHSLIQALIQCQQNNGGYLTPDLMLDIAERYEKPLHRVQELVSFYNSFRLSPPARVEVQVCRDFSCFLRHSPELIAALRKEFADEIEGGVVTIEGKSCIGQCDQPVAMCVNHHVVEGCDLSHSVSLIRSTLETGRLPQKYQSREIPDDWEIDCYEKKSEYRVIRDFLAAENQADFAESVLKSLEGASLVGKGGPGARTAKKWRTVKKNADDASRVHRFIVCNADESEPGTFKDRELLLKVPHLVLEGIITAALVIGAKKAYVYIRHEFDAQIKAMRECIADATALRVCGRNILNSGIDCEVEVYVSPGNYICGEQTAMIEAMEDKRAQPRQRPPDLEIQGLYNEPTLVNNVETFAWVPAIINRGEEWYVRSGRNGCAGKRFVSLSGDINAPGVYEVPLGATVGDLLAVGGGMIDRQELQAFAISGPSGGFLPRRIPRAKLPAKFVRERLADDAEEFDLLDLPLDNNFFRGPMEGCFSLGAAHLFLGERSDLISFVKSCTEFYRNESCGKCVPCRLGSEKLVQMAAGHHPGDRLNLPDYFDELTELMSESSICGLGQVAFNPLKSLRDFFPHLCQ